MKQEPMGKNLTEESSYSVAEVKKSKIGNWELETISFDSLIVTPDSMNVELQKILQHYVKIFKNLIA